MFRPIKSHMDRANKLKAVRHKLCDAKSRERSTWDRYVQTLNKAKSMEQVLDSVARNSLANHWVDCMTDELGREILRRVVDAVKFHYSRGLDRDAHMLTIEVPPLTIRHFIDNRVLEASSWEGQYAEDVRTHRVQI